MIIEKAYDTVSDILSRARTAFIAFIVVPLDQSALVYSGMFLLRMSKMLPSIIEPLQATELSENILDALSRSTSFSFCVTADPLTSN